MKEHPITPPPELVQQIANGPSTWLEKISKAYCAGADQELEACCELLDINGCPGKWIDMLRAALAAPEPEPTENNSAELAADIRRFLHGYQQMRGLDPENIYSIHRGDASEAHLRVSQLARIAEILEAQ